MASRESSDRSNNIEPSVDTDSDENNFFEGTVSARRIRAKIKDYVPTRTPSNEKKKIDSFNNCLQSIAKSFVEKDPADPLLKFLSEENERSKWHHMQMMKLLFKTKTVLHFHLTPRYLLSHRQHIIISMVVV